MIIIGIDPGATGAVAFLDSDNEALLDVVDIPVHKVLSGKTERMRVDRNGLLEIMNRASQGSHCFIERPEAHPLVFKNKTTGRTETRQPGAAGMFAFGENFGCCLMAATAIRIPLTEIRPGTWKRALSLSASKDETRRRCQELFPTFGYAFARVKDDGRGDATMLALYGARSLRRTSHV